MPYHASAVHFSNSSDRLMGTMTGADATSLCTSGWVKAGADLTVADNVAGLWQGENGPFVAVVGQSARGFHGYLYASVSDEFGAAFVQWRSTASVFTDNEWHHVLVGIDVSAVNHDNWKIVAYVDDQPITIQVDDVLPEIFPDGVITGSGPVPISIYGYPMHMPDFASAPSYPEDVADVMLWTGQSLIVDGTIPEATRRLFIDTSGKPVDPAVAIAELGTPAMFFSGDADSFPTNQGSGGGEFVGTVTDADTSPSDGAEPEPETQPPSIPTYGAKAKDYELRVRAWWEQVEEQEREEQARKDRIAELERQASQIAERKKQVSKTSAIAKRRAKIERDIAEMQAESERAAELIADLRRQIDEVESEVEAVRSRRRRTMMLLLVS